LAPCRDAGVSGARRMELRGGKLTRLGTAAGAARARPRPRARKEAPSRKQNPPRRAAQPTRARIQPGRRAPTPKPMRRSPAPRPPRRPVFVPFVRRTTRAASRATREQVTRRRARRRQRQAKLRTWRPRPGATHRRLIALLAALVLVFLAVGARLVDLQAVSRDRYAQLGLDQRVRKVQLAAERGSVFDRNGHDLAASVPQQTVWANPRVVTDPAAYAAQQQDMPYKPAAARATPMGSVPPSHSWGAATTVLPKSPAALRPAALSPPSIQQPLPALPNPAPTPVAMPAKVGDLFDDPWMRALVLAPDIRNYMTVTSFDAPDFRQLRPMMEKPDISIRMAFSPDPQLGMATDHFSGSAVVFLSTVTFVTRTASLQ